MAKQLDERPKTRLYLMTPAILPENFSASLTRVLEAGDVASVLVWGEKDEGAAYLARAKSLVPIIQSYECAALVRSNADMVHASGADGFHADTSYDEMKLALSNAERFIVGAANLKDRHSAMEAGEAGVDYVMFGDPRRASPIDYLVERVSWWQNLFEPPCIAVANHLNEITTLAQAGADFVALGQALWDEADPVASMSHVCKMMECPASS